MHAWNQRVVGVTFLNAKAGNLIAEIPRESSFKAYVEFNRKEGVYLRPL